MHNANALAQQLKGFITGKDAPGPCSDCFNDSSPLHCVQHDNDAGLRKRDSQFPCNVESGWESVFKTGGDDSNFSFIVEETCVNSPYPDSSGLTAP